MSHTTIPTFHKLDLQGLKTLLHWAALEGWNPGPHDAEVFWNTDPDGYYGFFSAGNLIAGGAIVSYQGHFGFMGLFIVKPEYRGEGLGRQLWHMRRDRLISRLNPGASIGMDGVVAMQPFYQKGGFDIAFKDERYENKGMILPMDPHISPIGPEDFKQVLAFDTRCFGCSRPSFLYPWLTLPDGHTFQYTKDGRLMGFAVVRKALSGYKIGPLFADNDAVADSLYRACLNAVPGQLVYLDIPIINAGAVTLVKKYNARYVFECARMYFGKQPVTSMDKVYGITTFELG